MAKYLDLDLGSLNPDDARQDALDYMASQAPPGWVPSPLIVWIVSAAARLGVLILTLAGKVPQGIYARFGTTVLGIPQTTATAATGVVTIASIAGPTGSVYTLDAGAGIDIDGAAFQTLSPVSLGPSATTTVTVQAVQAGTAGSGLAGDSVVLVSPPQIWVDSLTLTAPTAGGADGETEEEYVDRLPDEIGILSPKAILLNDVAVIARADPEVFRALPIRNYDASTDTDGVGGVVSVRLQNSEGGPVSTAGKARVDAALTDDDQRIAGIRVYTMDPVIQPLKAAVSVIRSPTVTDAQTVADVKDALGGLLNPVTYGSGDGTDPTVWVDEPVIRQTDLVVRTGALESVRHVVALTFGPLSGSLGTTDVTLPAHGGLPSIEPADITVTVTS